MEWSLHVRNSGYYQKRTLIALCAPQRNPVYNDSHKKHLPTYSLYSIHLPTCYNNVQMKMQKGNELTSMEIITWKK